MKRLLNNSKNVNRNHLQTETLTAYLEGQIKKYGLPDRAIYALGDAAMGYHVRPARYRHNADITDVLASRDLKQLVNAGFLMPHGERRGRVYTASSTLNDAASKIKAEEPSQIPDPFASLARRGLAKEQTKEPKEPEKLVTKEQFAQLRKEIGKIGRKIP